MENVEQPVSKFLRRAVIFSIALIFLPWLPMYLFSPWFALLSLLGLLLFAAGARAEWRKYPPPAPGQGGFY